MLFRVLGTKPWLDSHTLILKTSQELINTLEFDTVIISAIPTGMFSLSEMDFISP